MLFERRLDVIYRPHHHIPTGCRSPLSAFLDDIGRSPSHLDTPRKSKNYTYWSTIVIYPVFCSALTLLFHVFLLLLAYNISQVDAHRFPDSFAGSPSVS